MQLLEYISEDKELRTCLAKHATVLSVPKTSPITKEDLPQVCFIYI